MNESLEDLERTYREAQAAFAEDRSQENKEAYKQAKKAFEDARVAQRQEEEADPNHPRGQAFVTVDNDNTGEGE